MVNLISLRGEGPWQGKTSRSVTDRGQRRLRRLINGYVSSDGNEIRQFPGFHTICDLTPFNNGDGFERRIVDSRRPVYDWSTSNSNYQYLATSSQQTLVTFARPTHLHFFEQHRGALVIGGESDFRKNPIYGSPREELTVTGLYINVTDNRWILETSATPADYTLADTTAPGGNGLAIGDVVYVEIEDASDYQSPFMQAEINGLFCVVRSVFQSNNPGRGFVGLDVISAGNSSTSPHPATGNVWRTRCNRADVYPVSPWEPSEYRMIDDPPSLTVWNVKDALDLDDPCGLKAEPAWVANRQRDHGDQELANSYEGAYTNQNVSPFGQRSVSKRRQKSLPLRLVPELAGTRLIMAAPGYACVFQAPVVIPTDGENWPSPLTWSPEGGRGAVHWFNDVHDKPRALGIPKAILVDSVYTPAPTPLVTPTAWTPPYNFQVYSISNPGSVNIGWPAGTYRFAISYVDDYTDEEGLASEEVSITIPTVPATHNFGIRLVYMLPGYWFPETLALSINVYMANDADAPLGLYKRLPLQTLTLSTPNASAKYGDLIAGSPESSSQALYRYLNLPAPVNTTPIADARDTEKLAPQSLQMPRGAECYRVVRGVGIGVGSRGSHGQSRELLYSRASSVFDHRSPNQRTDQDQLQIRAAGTPVFDTSTPTTARDGPFGIASRYFPPAYQGVGIFSRDLYPAPRTLMFTDRILNNRSHNIFSNEQAPAPQQAHEQRLAMQAKIWDQDRSHSDASFTPSIGSPYVQSRVGKEVYVVEPRGQAQISEPGRPEVTTAVAIQFLDPNKDDDGVAIGNWNGNAIICSRQETFIMSWDRVPRAASTQQVSTEHGCISANSMVQFDGGLVWVGKRGPVAMTGNGLTWVGQELEHDFHGAQARYAVDGAGMMRHCWAAHDSHRGLVYFGLVTKDSTHQVAYKGVTATYESHGDEARSRFPCNEVLIWSYRVGSFSTWVPPTGLEVLWMRSLKDNNGDERMCFLAADNRIYALDEEWSDTNRQVFTSDITTAGNSTTSMVLEDSFEIDDTGASTARGTGENLVRTGMSVVIFDSDDVVVGKTTVSSAVASTKTVTLAAAQTWPANSYAEIGHRQDLRIVTTFIGDGYDNLDVTSVQMRYSLHGDGARAYARVNAIKSDLRDGTTSLGYTEEPSVWQPLGVAEDDPYSSRRALCQGRSVAPEVSIDVTVTGAAHVRIADLMLEIGDG